MSNDKMTNEDELLIRLKYQFIDKTQPSDKGWEIYDSYPKSVKDKIDLWRNSHDDIRNFDDILMQSLWEYENEQQRR